MGLKVTGVKETMAALQRMEERTSKASLRRFRRGAEQIVQRAKEYAPIDEGDLENAIVKKESPTGIRGRIEITVGVDPTLLGDGYQKTGFRYDIWTHEAVYNLGPLSALKQAQTGRRVGPKYLDRAIEDFRDEIDRALNEIMKREARL